MNICRFSVNRPILITLIPLIGSEFMPAADESEVRINAEMAVSLILIPVIYALTRKAVGSKEASDQ